MNRLRFSLVALLFCSAVQAQSRQQQAWISDQQRIPLYQDSSEQNRVYVGQVHAGTEIKILESKGDYHKVRAGELTGWLHKRYLTNEPSVHSQFHAQQQALQQLQAEYEALKNNHQAQSAQLQELQSALHNLQNDEQRARDELVALERVSGNVIAIDRRNRELETKIAQIEQENLTLRHKNTRLEENLKENQMMTGGMLVVLGMVVNWLFGNVLNRRRRSDFY